MRQVGRSAKLWDYYRSTDKEFKETVDKVRAARSKHGRIQSEESLEMDFRTFRKEYLEADTFPHQMNIINLLEGNEPEWMHSSMQFEQGRPQYVLVNVPPEHAKSMTTSIDYPVYRICMDPNVRIMIVSKSQQKATEFIYAIKQRLTHPSWQKLQLAYAAGSGFKSKSATWQATQVYLGDELRDSDQKDWKTLWPKSDRPWQGSDEEADEDGLYPRWDGKYLSMRRSALDPKTWSMVYQQADVDEDSTFNMTCVKGSIDRMRMIGPIVPGNPGHPETVEGLTIIAGLDPAIVGDTAAVVVAVDRRRKKRYILDAATITKPSPQAIRDLITTFTEKYKPSEWMVERNAFQGYLTQDENLRQWLASRGVLLREHTTSRNKWDVGFGVAAMASLFGSVESNGKHHRDNLMHLPSDRHEGIRLLIDQLVTWSPETKNKTDLVMALWFCEIRAREICQFGEYGGKFVHNEFLTRADAEKRQVINLDEWAADRRLA